MKTGKILLTLLAIYLTGCSSSNVGLEQDKLIDINNLQANLKFLASDELEGRESTTRGDKLASLFIATELEKYGVKPFIGDTSYFQNINLSVTEVDTSSKLIFSTKKGEVTLEFGEDFAFFNNPSEGLNESTAGFEFVGYGISAPEYGYDNYDGIDVTGKYILILGGEPQSEDSLFFDGDKNTKYSGRRYKISNAKEKGAIGYFMIADDRTQGIWPMLAQYSKKPRYDLPDPSDSIKVTPFSCILSQTALSRLLHLDSSIYSEVSEKISDKGGADSFRFSGEVKFSIIQNEDSRPTNNIVGVIPGIDPELKNEYIAIGAHYDHMGISDGTVFNGADDNGSGTVAAMEVAKALAQQRNNKRSILVVLHTSEEEGLFGSQYLTDNITIIDDIVAHVNLDMIGRESIDTLYSVGSDKLSSELKTLVEEVNQETVNFVLNYKLDDPNDPERVFYRSDHYNYAKHGIPVVFFSDNMQIDYHKPTDDYDKIDFDKIKKTSELVYSLVARLANLDHKLVVDKENK